MDNRRQQKIAAVIQEAFTDLMTKEGKGIYGNAFVTVTNVKVTSDLTLARIYLSVLNADKQEILKAFNEKHQEIKKLLGEKLRFQLRRIPELEFFIDDTIEHAFKIDELFKKIEEDRKQFDNNDKA